MKTLLSLLIVFSIALVATGCTTKEVTVVKTACAKPTINMSEFPEPKTVTFNVHKGAIVVTIKKSDYIKMKETNQEIKDRYVKLREWVLVNEGKGLIMFLSFRPSFISSFFLGSY